MSRYSSKLSISALLILAIILFAVARATRPLAAAPSPQDAVQTAWDNAKASPTFAYTSNILQTTYPAPKITSAGKPLQIDTFYIDALVDQHAEKMELELWNNDQEQSVTLAVDGTETKARVGADGEWEDIGTVSDFFAPGGDPLGFLAGASNIRAGEAQTLDFAVDGQQSVTFATYEFDFSGLDFGRFISDKIKDELVTSGELYPQRRA